MYSMICDLKQHDNLQGKKMYSGISAVKTAHNHDDYHILKRKAMVETIICKLVLLMIIVSLSNICLADFAGGSGTQEDPFLIANANHLDNVSYYLGYEHHDKHFRQTENINLGVSPWNVEEGWRPIGNSIKRFHGQFDGNKKVISGLTINDPEFHDAGLFGVVYESATIENVILEDVDITALSHVGALVGWNAGLIINCSSTGTVNAETNAGGLIGNSSKNKLIDCYSSCTVNGERFLGGLIGSSQEMVIENNSASGTVTGEDDIGGLIGRDRDSPIRSCFTDVTVTGERRVGGLVGFSDHSVIKNSYSFGEVNTNSAGGVLVGYSDASTIESCFSNGTLSGTGNYLGGLVGINDEGTITHSFSKAEITGSGLQVGGLVGANQGSLSNSYSRGNVSGDLMVGGLAGTNTEEGSIENCYSTGSVSGDTFPGGLVGFALFTSCTDSYWDTESSGKESSPQGEGRTTEQMTYPYDDNTYAAWDFDDIWKDDVDGTANDGYPYLFREEHVSVEDDITAGLPQLDVANYPNPFNPKTTIRFNLPDESEVSLQIFNTKGQRIRTAELGYLRKGEHSFVWNGADDQGRKVSSGLYLYRLSTQQKTAVRKMLMVK